MSENSHPRYDAVIVGAGFAGLYMLHRLRRCGFKATVFEAGSGVGGTWYWNRYPGARCDVESMEYSYSFDDELQQQWEWTERYAGQPEILSYANHVADRFDLNRDIVFDTRVVKAHFDETKTLWLIETDTGRVVSARFCILATGCLSSANLPDFAGRDDFVGDTYHTGRWPHEGVDFSGRRVGIVGTGSSAIQAIPVIAAQAAHLTVFQRTPNYSIPARNAPIDKELVAEIKAEYPAFRARNTKEAAGFGSKIPKNDVAALEDTETNRAGNYTLRWDRGGFGFLSAYNDLIVDHDANETAAGFVREQIRRIVDDPATAELLCPDNVIGCKRPCLDTGYFETYNRPNVTLVDVRTNPIERITPAGIVVAGKSPQRGSARGHPSQEESLQPGSARGHPSHGESPQPGSARGHPSQEESPQPGSARGHPSQEESPQPGSARGHPSHGESPQRGSARGHPSHGNEHAVDCIVFATGFDAMTGAMLSIDIRGRDGLALGEKWSAGPVTYLGLTTSAFPNLFMISGPGSPSVLTNMIVSIEQHVEWIADCLAHLRENGLAAIEATPAAENDWVAHVNAVADQTLYPTCNSWYLGKNIPGKPQVFMPLIGFPPYVEKCDAVVANGYEGFELHVGLDGKAEAGA